MHRPDAGRAASATTVGQLGRYVSVTWSDPWLERHHCRCIDDCQCSRRGDWRRLHHTHLVGQTVYAVDL